MRLSHVQQTVLEAMRAGQVIEEQFGKLGARRYYLVTQPGFARQHTVSRATFDALRHAAFVTMAGTLGRSWYEITALGRRALSQEQT